MCCWSQLVPAPPLTDVHAASQGQGGLAQGHTQRERLQEGEAAERSRPNASAALRPGVPLLLGLGKVSGSN